MGVSKKSPALGIWVSWHKNCQARPKMSSISASKIAGSEKMRRSTSPRSNETNSSRCSTSRLIVVPPCGVVHQVPTREASAATTWDEESYRNRNADSGWDVGGECSAAPGQRSRRDAPVQQE